MAKTALARLGVLILGMVAYGLALEFTTGSPEALAGGIFYVAGHVCAKHFPFDD